MKRNGQHRICKGTLSVVVIALLGMILLTSLIGLSANGTSDTDLMGRSKDLRPLANNGWVNVTTPVNPGFITRASMCYDSESDRIVLFGGVKYGIASNETWIYDFENNTWSNMSPLVSPSPRSTSIIYNSKSDRIILFGGRNDNNGTRYNDTWAYNFNTNAWTNMNPLTSPEWYYYPGIAYDSQSDRVISFSGDDPTYNDTWAYDYSNNTWTNMMPIFNPVGRADPKMAYDPKADRVVMFGGGMGSIWSNWSWNDTWNYDYKNNSWTEMHPAAPPVPRHDTSMVYDNSLGKMILFGGIVKRPDWWLNDTWSYNLWTNTWEEMKLSSQPSWRSQHTMSYDERDEAIVMFGGANETSFLNDTWIYQTNVLPPKILGTVPANYTKNVSTNSTITIVFSKAMDRNATESAISSSPSIKWSVTWSSHDKELSLIPNGDLQSGTTYTILISKDAKATNGRAIQDEFTFEFTTVLVPVSPPAIGQTTIVGMIIAAVVVMAAIVTILQVEWILYAFAGLLIPLFMRIRKEKILDNFTRGQVFEFIRENPGAHFRMIMTELKVSMGALTYHLGVLEKTRMITSKKDKYLKRFYPIDKSEWEPSQPSREALILSTLTKQPGLDVDTLANRLGVSRTIVRYHLRKLCDDRVVTPQRTREGIRYYCNAKAMDPTE